MHWCEFERSMRSSTWPSGYPRYSLDKDTSELGNAILAHSVLILHKLQPPSSLNSTMAAEATTTVMCSCILSGGGGASGVVTISQPVRYNTWAGWRNRFVCLYICWSVCSPVTLNLIFTPLVFFNILCHCTFGRIGFWKFHLRRQSQRGGFRFKRRRLYCCCSWVRRPAKGYATHKLAYYTVINW